jgi:hypothetical protein
MTDELKPRSLQDLRDEMIAVAKGELPAPKWIAEDPVIKQAPHKHFLKHVLEIYRIPYKNRTIGQDLKIFKFEIIAWCIFLISAFWVANIVLVKIYFPSSNKFEVTQIDTNEEKPLGPDQTKVQEIKPPAPTK